MNVLRSQPYAAALAGVMALLLLGGFFVLQRASVNPGDTAPQAWGGLGGNFLNPVYEGQPGTGVSSENIMQQVQSGAPFSYIPPSQNTDAPASVQEFDFAAFIALLSKPQQISSASSQSSSSLDSYSFIPTGLISTTIPGKALSPSQEALRQYGNEAGSYIQSFEEAHQNMVQVMKDHLEDPQNPSKAAAFNEIGSALAFVGTSLQNMEQVPSSVAGVHAELAKSYIEMGEKFQEVPKAQGDQARIDAMLTYNAAADTFGKKYVAVVTIFSVSEVSFGPDEGGSVFMFTNASF